MVETRKGASHSRPSRSDPFPVIGSPVTPASSLSLKSVWLRNWWLVKPKGKGLAVAGFATTGKGTKMGFGNLKLWGSFAKEAWEKSLVVAKFFCFLHVIDTYLCTSVVSAGPSMLPTLYLTGNLVLAEKVSPRFVKVGPGDIVLVRSPVEPRKVLTKRLIGLEGDTITYVVDLGKGDRTNTVVVPKGHIWVEGDNIYNSNDSRNFGPVPYGMLYGRLFWRVWPFEGFGSLRPK